MTNYWKEQILEIIKAVRHAVKDFDESLMDLDTIKILLKTVRTALPQEEKFQEAINIIDKWIKEIDEKGINFDGIYCDLDILEDIVEREIN